MTNGFGKDFGNKFADLDVKLDPNSKVPKIDFGKEHFTTGGFLGFTTDGWTKPQPFQTDINLQGTSANRKFVVCEKNWYTHVAAFASGQRLSGRPLNDYDTFLELARKYWTINPKAVEPSLIFLNPSMIPDEALGVPFLMKFSQPQYNPAPPHAGLPDHINLWFEIYQQMVLYPDKSQIYDTQIIPTAIPNVNITQKNYSPAKWKQLLVGAEATVAPGEFGVLNENVKYEYLAFQLSLPYSKEQSDNSTLPKQSYVEVIPEYNFDAQKYEHAISVETVPETILPNLYSLQIVSNTQPDEILGVNGHIINHVSLLARLKVVMNWANATKIVKNNTNYFTTYADKISEFAAMPGGVSADEDLMSVANKYKNIIIPSQEISNLKDMAERKELYPIHTTINISTEKLSQFTDILRETNLLDRFTMEIVKTYINKGHDVKRFREVNELLITGETPLGEPIIKKSSKEALRDQRVWDITKTLEAISLLSFDTGKPEVTETLEQHLDAVSDLIVLDPTGDIETQEAVPSEHKFYNNLMTLIAVQKLKKFFKTRIRTYEDLMKGKLNYSETVLYRIAKIPTDEGVAIGDSEIQNIWLANISEQDVITYVDTQLKYGEEYRYSIYAYQMVLESVYRYQDVHVNGSETAAGYDPDMPAIATVVLQPQVLLVEQEVHRYSFMILDSPPPPPQVDIVPYKDNPRQILINFSPSVDDYLADPIIIEMADQTVFDEIRKAQKKPAPEKIRFNADDTTGANGYYEVYRMNRKPSRWTDFAGHRRAIIANSYEQGSNINASTASLRDSITSNTKYYYMFRMVDTHSHISNPTVIYEIEMIEDRGAHYFTKKIVELKPREPRMPSKPCRRLIEIKPALDQQFMDMESFGDMESAFNVDAPRLGNAISPWDKKFKIRFVSRKTGKKLDLNLTCKVKLEKGNPDNE